MKLLGVVKIFVQGLNKLDLTGVFSLKGKKLQYLYWETYETAKMVDRVKRLETKKRMVSKELIEFVEVQR